MNLLDLQKTRLLHQWNAESPLIACRMSPTGLQCMTTAQDFTLQRWSLPGGEKVLLQGHESWVHGLAYLNQGELLVSGGCEGKLIWWSIGDAQPRAVRTIDAHSGWIRAVERSIDGRQFVSVGNDQTIRLWSSETGEKLAEWPGHERHIYSAAFHPDGQHLLTGDLLGKICVWKLDDQSLVRTIDAAALHSPNPGQNAEFGGVRSLAIHPDGSQIVAAGTHKATNPFGAVHEPLLLRFTWADGALVQSHVSDGIPGGLLYRTCWLRDGVAVSVSGGSSGGILLFHDSHQEKEIHRFQLPSLARDLDLHLPSGQMVTAHYDNHVRILTMMSE